MLPRCFAARFVALGLVSAGCASEPPQPSIPPVAYIPASTNELATRSPLTPMPAAKTEVSSAEVRAPIYIIARGRGRTTDQLGRMFAPTQERMAACIPGSSGVVNIHVESKGNTTIFSIDPNVTLDPKSRRCILETLSTLQTEPEDPTKRLGPEGYTSHIMISW